MADQIGLRVLIVDDVEDDALLAEETLRGGGYIVVAQRVDTAAALNAALDSQAWDLILCDYNMPHFGGLEALVLIRKRGLDLPCILLSGAIGEEIAVAALKAGADDYLLKDRMGRLGEAVRRALEEQRLRDDKRQAEEALRVAEHRLRTVVSNAPILLVALDRAGIITLAEGRGFALFATEPHALLGRSMLDLLANWPEAQEHVHQALAGTAATTIDDLGSVVTETQWVPQFDAQGEPSGTIFVATDITERRRAEQVLARERDLFQTLMDTMPDTIYFKDTSCRFVRINQADARVLGAATPEEAVGKTDFDYYPDDLASALFAIDRQVMQTGQPALNMLEEQVRPGLPMRWLLTSKAPIAHEGQVTGLVGISRDITALRQAEEAQRRSEEQYRRIVETANEGIWLLDPENRTLFVNARMAQLLGYTVDEMLMTTIFAYLDTETRSEAEQSVGRTKEGARQQFERRLRRKDGSALWTIMSTTPLWDAEGTHAGSLAMVTDITARKHAEEQLARQVARLSALRSIDLAITASVDLRLTLELILDQVVRQMGVDAAAVLVRNVHLQTLDFTVGRGFRTASASRVRLRIGEGHAGRAALERRIITVSDLAMEPLGQADLVADEGFAATVSAPLIAKGEVQGVLSLFQRQTFEPNPEWLDFLEALAQQVAIAIDNSRLFAGLQQSTMDLSVAYDATIEGWSRALDLRDKETEGHSQRVTALTVELARALGMSDQQLVHVRRGALLHDIGKMGIPDAILLKPGPLTEEEWVIMRQHPIYAYEMLVPITYLRPALDIPYRHHEKWDGAGYPHGLRGERIPLAARLFAVIDVYDALTSDRPYRPAWSVDRTREHIRSLAGSHFDPAVVAAFFALEAGS